MVIVDDAHHVALNVSGVTHVEEVQAFAVAGLGADDCLLDEAAVARRVTPRTAWGVLRYLTGGHFEFLSFACCLDQWAGRISEDASGVKADIRPNFRLGLMWGCKSQISGSG
jgi:hypothetical protein